MLLRLHAHSYSAIAPPKTLISLRSSLRVSLEASWVSFEQIVVLGLPVKLCCCLAETLYQVLALCSFVCMTISNTKKETSRNFLRETVLLLGHAQVRGIRFERSRVGNLTCVKHYYDTPKYVATTLGEAVSKKYRRLPRT